MGFSTPSWIDIPPPTGNVIDAANKGALQGYELGQKKAMYGALQGVNLDDSASLNAAQNRLIQTGNGAAADALIATSLARAKATTAQGALSLGDLGIKQERERMLAGPQATPDTPAHTQIMQDAVAALNTLQGISDPATRKAAADKMSADFASRGVPQENIDEITGDLSDAGLKAHADHLQAVASGGDEVPHPTGFAASRGVMANPVYAQAQHSLQQFAGHPWLQSAVEAAGLPIGGAISRDMQIVNPEISQEATAAHAQDISQQNTAGTNLANTNPATAPAPTPGAVRGADGSFAMAPGATNVLAAGQTATSAAQAAATAPYELVPGITDPQTGQPLYRTKADLAARNVPNGGVSPQQSGLNQASATQLQSDKVNAGQLQAQLTPAREVLRILDAPGTTTGPGTQDINHIRSFVQANLPWLKGVVGADAVNVANLDLLKKYLVRIAGAQAAQYGPGTNEKLAVAASGNPNTEMSTLGAKDAMRMNIALMRYDAARPAAYGGGVEGYSDYAANYGRTVDPRAFMWDLLSKDERQKVVATIKTPEERDAMARGLIAAEKAGYFHRNSLK